MPILNIAAIPTSSAFFGPWSGGIQVSRSPYPWTRRLAFSQMLGSIPLERPVQYELTDGWLCASLCETTPNREEVNGSPDH
jgi:hypothetical protein